MRRYNDTFKSSGSIDTSITSFIDILDIPQDNVQASLISPDGDSFIRGNLGWYVQDKGIFQ